MFGATGLHVRSGVHAPAPPLAVAPPPLELVPPLAVAPPPLALVPPLAVVPATELEPLEPDVRPPLAVLPPCAVLVVPPVVEEEPPLVLPLFESSLDEQPVTAMAMLVVQSNPKPNKKPRSVIPRA